MIQFCFFASYWGYMWPGKVPKNWRLWFVLAFPIWFPIWVAGALLVTPLMLLWMIAMSLEEYLE